MTFWVTMRKLASFPGYSKNTKRKVEKKVPEKAGISKFIIFKMGGGMPRRRRKLLDL